MSRYSYNSTTGELTLIAGNSYYNYIAPKETSPATAAHAEGTHIIFDGNLCEVTSDIAVDDVLAVGTNLSVADTLTEQIDTINQTLAGNISTLGGAINNKYLMLSPNTDRVSVVADGVKTYAELFIELYSAFKTWLQGLANDRYVEYTGISIQGGDTFCSPQRPYFHNDTAYIQLVGDRITLDVSNQSEKFERVVIGENYGYLHTRTLGASSATFSNDSSNVPTNGTTIWLLATVWRKVAIS